MSKFEFISIQLNPNASLSGLKVSDWCNTEDAGYTPGVDIENPNYAPTTEATPPLESRVSFHPQGARRKNLRRKS